MTNLSRIKVPSKDYKIIIGVPSTQYWAAQFGVSLAIMMAYSSQVKVAADTKTQHILLNNVNGSILPQMRQQMVDYAIAQKATHLLFVDSDMQFPRDTIQRLLSHNQKVVAANCCTKIFPATTTARIQPEGKEPVLGGLPLYSNNTEGISRVWRVGTGVMMLDMTVFKDMKRPFFSLRWEGGIADSYMGEDWALCEKLEELGIPIFVDHGLSREIGHIGTFNYNHDCIVTKEEEETVRQALAK